ncbi:MAG TPA: family 16 glycosylhydrolase [Verrucomicrobiae bacterium]|nr:family 16 glycosylhydrolase [Verrucomicrobiae bacterium]
MFKRVIQGGCLLLLTQVAAVASSNLLVNAGFELDPSGETQKIVGWQSYGGNAYGETGATAHSGTSYFKVYQAFNGQQNATGVYQDHVSGPGASYSAEGWAYVDNSDAPAGQNAAWIEVTFRDARGNILSLYKSAIINTSLLGSGGFPFDTWTRLAVTNQYDPSTLQLIGPVSALVAPARTSFVRCQILFQGDAAYSAGSTYFDDLNLTQIAGAAYGDWNLAWSEEFSGTSINTDLWNFELGNGSGGWGNNELEYYTSSPQNAFVADGLLHIVARRQSVGGFNYTSARMTTQGHYSRTYGRIEFRAKLPQGIGLWPALWMLGANINSVGWPACGEIDVVENSGADTSFVQGSAHSSTGDGTAIYALPGDAVTNFHTYLLEWTTNTLNWFVDGVLYETQKPSGAPFNQPFFFILNLAVGGNYVGNPSVSTINANTSFPAEMQVDYVRAYEETGPMAITASVSGGVLRLSWPTNILCHLQTSALPPGSPGAAWSNLSNASNPYTVSLTNSTSFFRLVSP